MDAMTKMWVSFFAIGLMVVSALLITFARTKTKGWLRVVISMIAFFLLLASILYGLISIL